MTRTSRGYTAFVGGALTLIATVAPAGFALAQPSETVQAAMKQVSADRIQASVEKLAGFGTRHTLSSTTSETRGIGAARNWLKQELEAAGVKAELESFEVPVSGRMPLGGTVVNVLGSLRGTAHPERAIYLMAHYDSRNADVLDVSDAAPGANDNASGTSAMLEIARVLGKTPQESTIIFLFTAGEEQSLLGATAHVSGVIADQSRPRPVAVLNNDIIGEPYGPGPDRQPMTRNLVRVFSEGLPRNATAEQLAQIRNFAGENDSPSRGLARYIADIARREQTSMKPMLVFRTDRFLRGGDHAPFLDRGLAAVRFTEVDEDYTRQHANVTHRTLGDGSTVAIGDTPDSIDPAYIADVARLNLACAIHLANAPEPPPRARIMTTFLTSDTTLRWDPSSDADVAGYELLWRETTAADWTNVKDVGMLTDVTEPLNKDNVFFGVRSYDKDGYRSLVVFPSAARQ